MAKSPKKDAVTTAEVEDLEGTLYAFSEDIGDAEAPEPLPERAFPATITDIEDRETQDGRPMVRIAFRINEEDYPPDYDAGNAPGGKTISLFMMMDDSAATRYRIRRFCDAIGAPMSKRLNPKAEWANLACQVVVKHEEYEGQKREKISRVEPA